MRSTIWLLTALAALLAASFLFDLHRCSTTAPAPRHSERGTPTAPPAHRKDEPTPVNRATTRIVGRTVDGLGTPLVGIRLTLEPDDGAVTLQSHPARSAMLGSASDHTGRFSLPCPPATPLALVARHPHFAARLVARDLTVGNGAVLDLGDVVLTETAGLLVTVTKRNGPPVRNAQVSLRPVVQQADLPSFAAAAQERTAPTDAQGVATFFDVAPGSYLLRARAEDLATCEVEYTQPAAPRSAPRTAIGLDTGRSLRGRVLDADDRPVAGASVAARAEGDESAVRLTAQTESDGTFRIDGLPARPVHVTAESYLHGCSTRDAVDTTDFLTVHLPRGYGIEGVVRHGRTAEPIAGARVRLEAAAGWPILRQGRIYRPETRTDAEGKFHFRGIPAGIWTVHASSEGLCSALLGGVEPGRKPGPCILELDEGASVHGVVRDPSGAAVANAMIDVYPLRGADLSLPGWTADVVPGQGRAPTTKTGPDGRFVAHGLRRGRHRVVVRATGFPAALSDPFDAATGAAGDLGAIHLVRGGTVEGVARDRAGRPVPGAMVYLQPASRQRAAFDADRVPTGNDGSFRFSAVSPGAHWLFYDRPHRDTPSAAAESRAATRVSVEVPSGQSLTQDLTPRH
ncbi:MAG: carboxypeptidase regulatory-like domain-containing protein [Planctomycetes bacterium]|nr:carboxypeptidase regulatory-like domain-containing protein [Planctomycetota bacterium]